MIFEMELIRSEHLRLWMQGNGRKGRDIKSVGWECNEGGKEGGRKEME